MNTSLILGYSFVIWTRLPTSYLSFYFFAYSEFVPGRSGLILDYGSLNQSGNATSCCPRLLCTQGYLYDPVLAEKRAAFISGDLMTLEPLSFFHRLDTSQRLWPAGRRIHLPSSESEIRNPSSHSSCARSPVV